MTDFFPYIMGFGIGILVGFFYFGGLWFTIRKVPQSQQPNRLLFLSFVMRLLPTLMVMYFLIRSDPGMFVAMLITFFGVRFFMIRKIAPSKDDPSQEKKVSNVRADADGNLCNLKIVTGKDQHAVKSR